MNSQDLLLRRFRPRRDNTGHGRHAFDVDLRPLREGHPGRRGLASFRGRPIMGNEVANAIFHTLGETRCGKPSATSLKQCAFGWFRFLDCKNIPDCSVREINRALLRDFASSIEHLKDPQRMYCGVSSILENAFTMSGGKHLMVAGREISHFPRNPFVKGGGAALLAQHIYSEASITAMINAALTDVANVNARFAMAYAIAARGQNPVELNREQRARGLQPISPEWKEVWTLENTLWFVHHHGICPISASEFERRTEIRSDWLHHPASARQPASSTGHTQMQSGLGGTLRWFLPGLPDLTGPILSLALTTPWNESSILDMKRSELIEALNASSSQRMTILSRKSRSRGAKQTATLRDVPGWIPDALRSVLAWTHPLHQSIQSELREVTQTLRESPAEHVPQLQCRREALVDLVDRVWLFMPTKKVGIARVRGHHLIKEVRSLFEEHAVPESRFSFRAARDSYVNSITSSKFEAGLLAAVLHHRDRRTTFRYVDKTSAAPRLAFKAFIANTAIQESIRRSGHLDASLISSLVSSSEHAHRR
jgi:hypothetical protein